MKASVILLLSMLLAACAATPVAPRAEPDELFNDQLFAAPSERISAADVFALSDAMKHFLNTEIVGLLHAKGLKEGFADALFVRGRLIIEYDAEMTRNAAQTFAAHAGNCLSLVIMTAAMAKESGLPVRYQSVYMDDTWSRTGDVYFSIGHVNIALGRRQITAGIGPSDHDQLTIDFLPPQDARYLRTRGIEEQTIVAMYMNNRAAEAFVRGQLDDAYWWARAAIEEDPGFFGSYNTLGVIYQHHGNPKEAEKVFAYALEREPENTHVMSNLARLLGNLGRVTERNIVMRKLEQLEPHPPFSYFNLGMNALREGNPRAARDLFAKEVARAPYYHAFRFWLGIAYLGLGDTNEARQQLALAKEYATKRDERELYAAKLDRIRSTQLQ